MASSAGTYKVLLQRDAHWRESNMMKIPNTNLAEQLGTQKIGARLWRLPPFSANTWHRHVEQDELYFVLEGTGRIRVGGETLTIPRHGSVLVGPSSRRRARGHRLAPRARRLTTMRAHCYDPRAPAAGAGRSAQG